MPKQSAFKFAINRSACYAFMSRNPCDCLSNMENTDLISFYILTNDESE